MAIENKQITLKKVGFIDYPAACALQETYVQEIIAIKLANRTSIQQQPTPNYLLFCEHPPVYTLGRKSTATPPATSPLQPTAWYTTNRGGDITYHGPGQLVIYPILDLANFFTDIHRYLRLLEAVVIATLHDWGIDAGRIQGLTGVWVHAAHTQKASKICAIGIRVSRWITMHGLALNINTDLQYFDAIVPCGIPDKKVTSMAQQLGKPQNMQHVQHTLQQHLLQALGARAC